jgi:GT2 family glycosyltransferase
MACEFSVVIPSWNAREMLRQCLESLRLEADPARTELIVVDNASTDGSWEMVQEAFPEVLLIRNRTNLGFAKACNIGVRRSRGRYVCLVNSDVMTGRDCLARLARHLDGNPRLGMVGPRILGVDGTPQRSYMGFPTIWNTLCAALALPSLMPRSSLAGGWMLAYRSFSRMEKVDVLNGAFLVVRREALEKVGLLDEGFFMYGEDVDWCRRFWQAGWDVAFCPDAEVVHHGGASSARAPVRFYVEMHRSRLRYFRKHHGRRSQLAYRAVAAIHQMVRVAGNSLLYACRPSRRADAVAKMRRSRACLAWLLGVSLRDADGHTG